MLHTTKTKCVSSKRFNKTKSYKLTRYLVPYITSETNIRPHTVGSAQ